jgi:hypothetical protein
MIAIRFVACQGAGDLSTRHAAVRHSGVRVDARELDFVEVTATKGTGVYGTKKASWRVGRALQWVRGSVGDCDAERRSVRIKRAAGALERRLWIPLATNCVDG